ncbi:restriction endonuclease subunit S [Laspinema olomoucense]|uniref:restriction endonuclease subunit S n=1 Tax=Laspinema olomoucense TaxID=3231600 RepID=UPI0021BA81AD|nr:restriction endonuclease subunit S [Laspinema sp. D3c]MCT7993654.1 restriction endonuclease subunit S [Laspinema sp. D3c]
MSKKLKKNVPVLRFPEFEGEWESKKLKNITSKIGSGATPIGGDSNYKEFGISLFRSLNVYDGFFKLENLAFIDENQAHKLNNVIVKKGDILLNITGASIARCCIAPVELLPARVNQHVMIIRPDSRSVKTEFLALLLICVHYKKKLFQLGGKGGSTREALTKDHIENFLVNIPKIAEQEKIASFLGALDTRLNQLHRKREHLQTYKRGVMQKLFSQKISFKRPDSTPFPDWKTKKLGSITKIYDGTHQTPNYVEKGIPFYSVESLTSNDFTNTKFISEDVFLEEQKRVRLEKGDILMTRIGDIGTCRLIDWDVKASFYVSLALVKASKITISAFLAHFISSIYFQKELHKRTIHVAFPRKINLGEIGNCEILIPCIEEQEKIANFLTTLDRKIEILSCQIDQTEQFKKGLLQKLFV